MSTANLHRRVMRLFERIVAVLPDSVPVGQREVTKTELVPEVRAELEPLIATIPDVGGRPPFTLFIYSTAMFLALYRVVQRRGGTVDETGELVYQLTERYIESLSPLAKALLSRSSHSHLFRAVVRRGAMRSAAAHLPEGFVFTYVDGENQPFDYGVDYSECAVVKLLERYGARELAPHVCRLDVIYSDAFGWGLKRTETIASGAERCDFRFREGEPTEIAETWKRSPPD